MAHLIADQPLGGLLCHVFYRHPAFPPPRGVTEHVISRLLRGTSPRGGRVAHLLRWNPGDVSGPPKMLPRSCPRRGSECTSFALIPRLPLASTGNSRNLGQYLREPLRYQRSAYQRSMLSLGLEYRAHLQRSSPPRVCLRQPTLLLHQTCGFEHLVPFVQFHFARPAQSCATRCCRWCSPPS